MRKHVIAVKLTEIGIDHAIKELEEYKKSLSRKCDELRNEIAKRIRDIAQEGFSNAISDDLLDGSGGSVKAEVTVEIREDGDTSVVFTDGEDAIWVEFGSGVYHNGSVGNSPHPKGAGLGYTIGGYGKGNGAKRVWGFRDEDGELKLTHGAPAQMPMWKAVLSVIDDIDDMAKEIFG